MKKRYLLLLNEHQRILEDFEKCNEELNMSNQEKL